MATGTLTSHKKESVDIEQLKLGGTAVTATAAELSANAGVTAGTVTASKTVVADANKDMGVFRRLSTKSLAGTDVTANQPMISGPAPSALINTAGAATYLIADLVKGFLKRDPNGAGRTDVLPTAALIVAGISGLQVGDIIECLIINCADAAETITISAGGGGAFDTDQIAATRIIPQNTSRSVFIRMTNVTASSEAYVVYM